MERSLLTQFQSVTTISHDSETRARHMVDGMIPEAVLLPGSEAEVGAALQVASRADAVVVPWGAGSRQGLGRPPERVDLVLSLARLNQVVEYVQADMTITVQAGTPLVDLQAIARRHGQFLPLDPPWPDRSTLGGLIATAASGPRRMAYGAVRDLLLGTRVAMADGRIIKTGARVVKNVAGYDMNKLLCGSLGTLGVITEATLKLRPVPTASQTLLLPLSDLPSALALAEEILQSELLPAAVALLSAGAAARMGVPGPVTLAIALEETPENVAYQAGRLATRPHSKLSQADETRFWSDLTSHQPPWQVRVNTVISDMVNHLEANADAIAYVGSGTVILSGPEEEPWGVIRRAEQLFQAAQQAGGSAVLEVAAPQVRRLIDPWGPIRPEWRLMQAIKQRFDPGKILNRGRYVGGI